MFAITDFPMFKCYILPQMHVSFRSDWGLVMYYIQPCQYQCQYSGEINSDWWLVRIIMQELFKPENWLKQAMLSHCIWYSYNGSTFISFSRVLVQATTKLSLPLLILAMLLSFDCCDLVNLTHGFLYFFSKFLLYLWMSS